MSTLTGQYISQSYGGIINLSTNTGIVAGTFTQLQDGLGTNLGVFINGQSAVSASSFTGSLQGTSSYATSALSSSYAITASYAENAGSTINTGSFATTGSNQFNGNQSVSGSVSISSSINVLPQEVGATPTSSINRISFYTGYDAGPGNYRDFMQSLTPDFNIGFLYGSEVIRIAGSETTFNTNNVVLNTNLNARGGTVKLGDNASHNTNITGSLGISGSTTQTGSVDIQGTVNASSFTGSLQGTSSFAISASYASSATFTFGLTLSGSVIITGSSQGNVTQVTVSSNTASIDLSKGSYFNVHLPNSTNVFFNITNLLPGTTSNVVVNTGTNNTASFSSNVLMPSTNKYIPTSTSASIDILNLLVVDGTKVFVTNAPNQVCPLC